MFVVVNLFIATAKLNGTLGSGVTSIVNRLVKGGSQKPSTNL